METPTGPQVRATPRLRARRGGFAASRAFASSLPHAIARSLQRLSTRITAIVALGALVIMALAHFTHVRLFNEEMRPQIGKHLLATVTRAADDVDGQLERRVRALEAAGFDILTESRDFDARSAQEYINSSSVLASMFDHVMLVGPDGHVLADRPHVAVLRNADLSNRDHFKRARDTSRLAISEPYRSTLGDFQVVAMTMPIIDRHGDFGGCLIGTLNLERSGLFADIRNAQIGDTGYFEAVSLKGVVIVHPDASRILRSVLGSTEDPGLHRALAGWNGWQEGVVDGVPALTAYKRLKQVPWLMVAVQPSDEAFAPLVRMDRVLQIAQMAAVIVLSLLVWVVTWRALVPLARLRDQIEELDSGKRIGNVDTAGPREIAVVARAFNRLNLKQQSLGDALAQREAFHRTLNEESPVGVFLIDEKGQLTYCNARFEQMIGLPFERICGVAWVDAIHPEDRATARERWLAARWARQAFDQEFRLVQPRGDVVWARFHHQPMGLAARAPEYLVVALDVTAEREAAERLRSEQLQGQLILEAISDALVVVAANGRVREMTRAAERLTGWARDKANGTPVGRVVRVFDHAGAAVDLAKIIDSQQFRTEEWTCEVANGERIAVELTWQCFDDSLTSGGLLSLRDITERRRVTARMAWAAAHDALTGLKNRRSFEEALSAARGHYLRSGEGAAIVMIDLDHFKQVNDRGGHDAGDEMLRNVTHVLGEAVRVTDTAARVGGDEFALLLPGCNADRALMIVEKIRDQICALAVIRDNERLSIGASFGIAELRPGDADWTDVLQRADAACYEAKNAGRNAVRVAQLPMADPEAEPVGGE